MPSVAGSDSGPSAMAAAMVNGSAGTDANAVSNAMSPPGKQPSKQSFANKVADGNRKQTGPPNDGAPRRPSQKAWQSGMNPITQRSNTPAQQNGNASQNKASTTKPLPNHEVDSSDRVASERLNLLYGNSIGLSATITTKSGEAFKGIFCGMMIEGQESAYLIKMAQQFKSGGKGDLNGVQESSSDFVGAGDDYAMTFEVKDVVHLAIEGALASTQNKMQNGVSTGFRTDVDISGNMASRQRDLQRWEPATAPGADMSLEASSGTWDQFQTNEQLFGVKSDYDENLYTTRIDRSTPDYRQREAEAQRIAREIEGTAASNVHVREERGDVNDDDGLDEETRYSEVSRQTQDYPPLQSVQSNRYMPPARRLPTSKATVPGAPVDPAIIASQVARSDQKNQSAANNQPNQGRGEAQPVSASTSALSEQPKAASKVSLPADDPNTGNRRTSNAAKGPIPSDSATANVEVNLLDSFRNFANIEKMRVSDHRRQRVSQDKAVKLNDLMKFSQNFKLNTPVPKDLVPILAKDKSKQEEIMEKAQRAAQQVSNAPTKPVSTSSEQTPLKAIPEGPRDSSQPAGKLGDRPDYPYPHHGFPSQSPQAAIASRDRQQQMQNLPQTSPKSGQGLLSHRLQDSHRQHKAGMPVNVPNPLPIQSRPPTRPATNAISTATSQTPGSVRTPTSAVSSKFNIKAAEFKPNPAASSFKPPGEPGAVPSPMSTPSARPISRAPTPTAFFGNRKPLPATARLSILENFNPIKRLKENAQEDGVSRGLSSNNGIEHAFRTPPTWKLFEDESEQRSYADMFDGPAPASGRVSPQPLHQNNHTMAHQHQLPQHLQHGLHAAPHMQTGPHQAPYSNHSQGPHYQSSQHQYDDHRMHLSASNQPMYPSPRMQNNAIAYPSPMPQQAQLAFGQPMPQYMMGFNGPQPGHFRQFPNGPQMMPAQGPQLAAPMMIQQPSQGGFAAPPHGVAVPFTPQMHMYPPGQAPSYGGQSQPPSGYPSPGRGAPMMMHQGSHQGQQPMYMNPGQYAQPVYAQQQPPHMTPMQAYGSPRPHYAQSPQPQYNYPPQPHRVLSNSYGQPSQGPHQHHHHQQMHHGPPNHTVNSSEDMK